MNFSDVIILNNEEEIICWLNPEFVTIEETNEQGKIRSIKLTHPRNDDYRSYPPKWYQQGNKIYIPKNQDIEACLYVIDNSFTVNYWDKDEIEVSAEDVLVELNYVPGYAYATLEHIKVTKDWLKTTFGEFFTIGEYEEPSKNDIYPVGTMTLMSLLRFIEDATGNIFVPHYKKLDGSNIITRSLDFLTPDNVGTDHKKPNEIIQVGYNTDSIEYSIDESDCYSAIQPLLQLQTTGSVSSSDAESSENTAEVDVANVAALREAILNWYKLEINEGDTIPMIVEKTTDGEPNYTAYWNAPFSKIVNQLFLEDNTESDKNYDRVYKKPDLGQIDNMRDSVPKIGTVSTSDTDKYAIYNDCANKIYEKRDPKITIETTLTDLRIITGNEETYNLGDTVYIRLLERNELVVANVTKTVKNNQDPGSNKITISNTIAGKSVTKDDVVLTTSGDLTQQVGQNRYFIAQVFNSRTEEPIEGITVSFYLSTTITTSTVEDTSTDITNTDTDTGTEVGAKEGVTYHEGKTADGQSTITTTAYPSCAGGSHPDGYKLTTKTWLNKCPKCGKVGSLQFNPKGVAEGELTCGDGKAPYTDGCDADFCCVDGKEKLKTSNVHLESAVEVDTTNSEKQTTTTTSSGTTQTVGKTYYVKTDKEGMAKLQINLGLGVYKCKTTVATTKTTNSATKNNTINVVSEYVPIPDGEIIDENPSDTGTFEDVKDGLSFSQGQMDYICRQVRQSIINNHTTPQYAYATELFTGKKIRFNKSQYSRLIFMRNVNWNYYKKKPTSIVYKDKIELKTQPAQENMKKWSSGQLISDSPLVAIPQDGNTCSVNSLSYIIQLLYGNFIDHHDLMAQAKKINKLHWNGSKIIAKVAAANNYTMTQISRNSSAVIQALSEGKLVWAGIETKKLTCEGWGTSNTGLHAIVIYGVENGKYKILDPNGWASECDFATIDTFAQRDYVGTLDYYSVEINSSAEPALIDDINVGLTATKILLADFKNMQTLVSKIGSSITDLTRIYVSGTAGSYVYYSTFKNMLARYNNYVNLNNKEPSYILTLIDNENKTPENTDNTTNNSGLDGAIWVRSDTMTSVNFTTLANNGITNIFLNYAAIVTNGADYVSKWATKANNNGVKVHIWMQLLYENGGWQNPILNGSLNSTLLNNKIEEAKSYVNIPGINGIHLDYMRYPGNAYETTGGTEAVTSFVSQLVTAIKNINSNLIVSGALMPETSQDDYYYGQDVGSLSQSLDIICPMVYKGNYGKTTNWIQTTTKWFIDNSKGAKVYTGLQTYVSDSDTTLLNTNLLATDITSAYNGGAKGVALFRFGLTNFINLKTMSTNRTNTGSTKTDTTIIPTPNPTTPTSTNLDNVSFNKSSFETARKTIQKSIVTGNGVPTTVTMTATDGKSYTLSKEQFTGLWNTRNEKIVDTRISDYTVTYEGPNTTTFTNMPVTHYYQNKSRTGQTTGSNRDSFRCGPRSLGNATAALYGVAGDVTYKVHLGKVIGIDSSGSGEDELNTIGQNFNKLNKYDSTLQVSEEFYSLPGRINKTFEQVKSYIDQGIPVLLHTTSIGSACLYSGSYGHHMIIVGYTEDTKYYHVVDPWSSHDNNKYAASCVNSKSVNHFRPIKPQI